MHVVVIGAGIVGTCCAIELRRDGHAVTLVDAAEPGGEQAASYGNGAWISPASVVPMSMPGLWKKLPGYLLDREGALTLRWSALPALAPWLLRFVRAGSSVARVERTARALSSLLCDAPARHAALALQAGVAHLIARQGLLYAYADRAAFAGEALAWRLRRDNRVGWRELEEADLRALLPMLDARYRFGVLVPEGAHCLDPGGYVASLARHVAAQGGRLMRAQATGLDIAGGRLRAVATEHGPIACDRAVIAAGIGSKELAAQAGDRVLLESERGYHAVLADAGFELPVPVMPADGKMGNTSTLGGLRLAGQVELAAPHAPPDWRRADILVDHALRAYPPLRRDGRAAVASRWMGHRPSTPDGLPVLGKASGCADVLHAFGHGHVGLASAPVSGRIVADMVGAKPLTVDCAPFSAQRFR
jgi:D-amino-acid dehydrogenase